MFSMWTCFSLLCAATILQSSTSNAVSLNCSDTVKVDAGEDVTLNCSITDTSGDDCEGVQYQWSNSTGVIQCNSDLKEYICGWDNLTYVYLTISNVIKEENYTVSVLMDCDFPQSSAIKVRVQAHSDRSIGVPEPSHSHVPTILGILVTTAAVVGFLCFLFITNRGRQIIKRMKNEETQRGEDGEAEKEKCAESLTNSDMCV